MSKKRSAKGQFVKSAGKRATKATPVARPKRKRRRNPAALGAVSGALAPVSNPPDMRELADFILPGFAGFGVTKLLARIVNTQASKKWPNAGKHVAVGSTVVAFLAAWMLLHRIKKLAPYQMPAAVGAGIAALQTIVSTYLPRYGWMVGDASADAAPSLLTTSAASKAPVETLFPGGPEIVDDPADDSSSASLNDIDLGSLGGGSLGGGAEEELGLN